LSKSKRRRQRKLAKKLDAAAEQSLPLVIERQPDDTTCGPTCLHAVYQFHGDDVPLEAVIAEAQRLEEGGTLAALLGSHALSRGYKVTIHTYNLQVFDPTWFRDGALPIARKLMQLAENRTDRKLKSAARAYIQYLDLLRRYLKRGVPILTGLSSTFLYRAARELPGTNDSDDVRGHPAGHFVVLSGYREVTREVRVSDPWHPNPVSEEGTYWVSMSRVINSILLGILTYDANLVIIEKKNDPSGALPGGAGVKGERAYPRRRQ
jgi:hypothetical protein